MPTKIIPIGDTNFIVVIKFFLFAGSFDQGVSRNQFLLEGPDTPLQHRELIAGYVTDSMD